MNFNSDEDMREEMRSFKNNIIKICTIIIMIIVVANIVVLSAFKTNLAEDVSSQLISDVVNNVENSVSDQVATNLTDAVLSQYTREYKLRDEDVSIGTYVASLNINAVLDIVCSGRVVSDATIVSAEEIRYSYKDISSTATGMVINEQGYVLTNAHVVVHDDYTGEIVSAFGRYQIEYSTIEKLYTSIYASFYGDDTLYELTVVDYDSTLDLAVLKFVTLPEWFSAEGFDDYVAFGDSEALELGESAVIIGNAYDLGISVTTGTITNTSPDLSAYDVGAIYSDGEIIQTDTAINSGNSGGPMFDSTAYCIGVASFKISTDTTEGLGFAIASNLVVKYINSVSNEIGGNISIYTYYDNARFLEIIA